MSDRLPFDPDEVARAHGEGHLIPLPVRRLSEDERRRMYPEEYAALHPDGENVGARRRTPGARMVLPI